MEGNGISKDMADLRPLIRRLSKSEVAEFQSEIYEKAAILKKTFPWRENPSPYRVLVSEFMLQQTQSERVTPYFLSFMKQFPSLASLAQATLGEVLRAWGGLGYNRRAKYLWTTVRSIYQSGGIVPSDESELQCLPGIGPYTAGAIAAFAYNRAVCFIDTNIRRVYIHHFFPAMEEKISDRDILTYVECTLDREHASSWYNALMDVGSELHKGLKENPNVRSKGYRKQTAFEGSLRQLRGKIIRSLIYADSQTLQTLSEILERPEEECEEIVVTLEKEGFLVREAGNIYLS